jgi:hypothetical protein
MLPVATLATRELRVSTLPATDTRLDTLAVKRFPVTAVRLVTLAVSILAVSRLKPPGKVVVPFVEKTH